jgi:hypothetical protein
VTILTPPTTAGAMALLFWEICITFGDELRYIWPWATRYHPLVPFFPVWFALQKAQLLSDKMALSVPPINRLVRPTVRYVKPSLALILRRGNYRGIRIASLSIFNTSTPATVHCPMDLSGRRCTKYNVIYGYHFDDARLVYVRHGI